MSQRKVILQMLDYTIFYLKNKLNKNTIKKLLKKDCKFLADNL